MKPDGRPLEDYLHAMAIGLFAPAALFIAYTVYVHLRLFYTLGPLSGI